LCRQDGFNLNILLGTLVPAAMVYEADVPWTFESLLRVSVDYWLLYTVV
jgi:hypothetical protein